MYRIYSKSHDMFLGGLNGMQGFVNKDAAYTFNDFRSATKAMDKFNSELAGLGSKTTTEVVCDSLAFNVGLHAAQSGKGYFTNPYEVGTPEYNIWCDGWDTWFKPVQEERRVKFIEWLLAE